MGVEKFWRRARGMAAIGGANSRDQVIEGAMLLDLFLKIAPSVLSQAAKASLHVLLKVPPVSKAVDATATSFPQLPAVGHTLGSWCEGDEFRRLLEEVKAGSRDLSQDHLDRRSDAIQVLERLSPEGNLGLVLANAYVDEGLPEKAIALLAPRLRPGSTDRWQLEIADTLLTAHGRAGNESEAEALARSIAETFPNDPEALAIVARHRRRQKRTEDAIALLREALAYASGHRRDLIALELADTYAAVQSIQ